jgi:hypothetical protein
MGSTSQPHFGQDAYPISRFIVHRAQALGLSRSGLARHLPYQDLGKAHRELDATLTTGTVPAYMQRSLADALEVDDAILDAVMAATARQQHDEGRARLLAREQAYVASFRPHLRAETARTVSEPIFIAALVGTVRLLHVAVPPETTWDATADERARSVKQAIRDHYRERNGHVPAFGAILGYTLVVMPGYLVDFGFPFDTAGDPAGPMQAVNRFGQATLGVKRGDARLTGLLRNAPISIGATA